MSNRKDYSEMYAPDGQSCCVTKASFDNIGKSQSAVEQKLFVATPIDLSYNKEMISDMIAIKDGDCVVSLLIRRSLLAKELVYTSDDNIKKIIADDITRTNETIKRILVL